MQKTQSILTSNIAPSSKSNISLIPALLRCSFTVFVSKGKHIHVTMCPFSSLKVEFYGICVQG